MVIESHTTMTKMNWSLALSSTTITSPIWSSCHGAWCSLPFAPRRSHWQWRFAWFLDAEGGDSYNPIGLLASFCCLVHNFVIRHLSVHTAEREIPEVHNYSWINWMCLVAEFWLRYKMLTEPEIYSTTLLGFSILDLGFVPELLLHSYLSWHMSTLGLSLYLRRCSKPRNNRTWQDTKHEEYLLRDKGS